MKTKLASFAIPLFLVAYLAVPLLSNSAHGQNQKSSGVVTNVQWNDDSVHFNSDGKRFSFDLTTLEKSEVEASDRKATGDSNQTERRRRQSAPSKTTTGTYLGRPTRGRQYTRVMSPDEKWEAVYEDWNLVLVDRESKDRVHVTTDGNEDVHYGTACWVYGEELRQTKAMWWSPDSKKILYYRFDDSNVKQFYLLRGLSEIGTEVYPEYYPKAGAENPGVSLFIYDLESKESIKVNAGGGSEEYIYGIRTSPDGNVMLLNWTDRLQRHLKVLAIDLETGDCRTVVEEKQENWQTNSPRMRYLSDNKRFIWPSDRSGFTHYELRDLDGQLINPITQGEFQVTSLNLLEDSETVTYTANSCESNPYYAQFHMVGLNGKNNRRVTTLDAHHSRFNLSPDGKWLIAQYEEVNTPPCTAIYRTDGTLVAKLAESDPALAANLAEMFKFRSSDDQFDIYGILYKPADFDPNKKYPVINALYGGPGSNEIRANYVSRPYRDCQRGYLVVKVNNRGTGQRGKKFTDSTYGRLGDVDIQDHADAIRMLRERKYFDGDRVGIVGHSYGGYMAAMGITKHPDVYAASVIRAGVTDWQNYDSIYTERYMSTPQLNPEGYKVGAAMTHAKNIKGQLLIMHGMLDDNVHPNNAFQLIETLDKHGIKYESRFWPNAGHGLGRGAGSSQNEFFDRILLAPQSESTSTDSTPTTTEPKTASSTSVSLNVVLPSASNRRMGWSPKGEKIAFVDTVPENVRAKFASEVGDLHDPVFGTWKLGAANTPPLWICIDKKSSAQEFRERIILDANRDGKIDTDREIIESEAKEIRGRTWVSFNGVAVSIPFESTKLTHEFSLWLTYPKPDEEGDFNSIRFSRGSWLEGTGELNGQALRFAFVDADNNAKVDEKDAWCIVPDDEEADAKIRMAMTNLAKPCFIESQAYRVSNLDASGTTATLSLADDVKPKKESIVKQPARPKTATPIQWTSDLDAAKKQSAKLGKPVLVKWGASWCGPCKVMDREAFADKEVAGLLKDCICVKLDRDDDYKIAQKQKVQGVPAILLLDSNGSEVTRGGFFEPAEFASWLNSNLPKSK